MSGNPRSARPSTIAQRARVSPSQLRKWVQMTASPPPPSSTAKRSSRAPVSREDESSILDGLAAAISTKEKKGDSRSVLSSSSSLIPSTSSSSSSGDGTGSSTGGNASSGGGDPSTSPSDSSPASGGKESVQSDDFMSDGDVLLRLEANPTAAWNAARLLGVADANGRDSSSSLSSSSSSSLKDSTEEENDIIGDRWAPAALSSLGDRPFISQLGHENAYQHQRNFKELEFIASVIDALIEEGMDSSSTAVEMLVRRFIGVNWADDALRNAEGKKSNAWARMDVLQFWGKRSMVNDLMVRRLDAAAARRIQLYGGGGGGGGGGGKKGGSKSKYGGKGDKSIKTAAVAKSTGSKNT